MSLNIHLDVKKRHLTAFFFLMAAITLVNYTIAQPAINPGHDAGSIRGGGFIDGNYYFSNSLGVGGPATSDTFHVYGDSAVEGASPALTLRDTDDGDWRLITTGADELAFQSDTGSGFQDRMLVGQDKLRLMRTGIQTECEDGQADIEVVSYGNNAGDKGDLDFFKARGTSSAPQEAQYPDIIGTIRFNTWCSEGGGTFSTGAQIKAVLVEGASLCSAGTGGEDVPMALEFFTKENSHGGGSPVLERRMYIDHDGKVVIGNPPSNSISDSLPSGSLILDNGILCVDNGGDNCDDAVRVAGNIYAESSSITTIDVAENYPTRDMDMEAGDLVGLDVHNTVFVKRSGSGIPLIGVVSTEPGLLLGGFANNEYEGEMMVPVALAGRVPARVSTEGGTISIGDRIGVSSVPGVGMKVAGGPSAGIALEPFRGEGTGSIMLFVNLDY